MRGKNLNSISFYAPLDQRTSSLSIRFNNFPPYSFHIIPTHSKKKKKKKNLSILQLNSKIPSLLFPPLFLQKKEICTPMKFSILNQIWHSPFPGEEKKRGEKWRGEKKRAEDRNDPSRDVNSTSTRYEVKQPARAVFPRKGRSFCRVSCAPIKKRMAENRGSHVIFGRYSSFERNFLPAFPPKSKGGIRRETAENCCNAVFYWAAERWFRSTKRRNHEQRSAMHNGIQGMRTEGVPFFRMSMQIRLFTDDDGEK